MNKCVGGDLNGQIVEHFIMNFKKEEVGTVYNSTY